MNKKGLIKIGISAVLTIFMIFLLSISFLSYQSTAIIQSNSYILGEKVKINLLYIENYTIKIITPSTTYIKEGSKDVFLFKPEETGLYKINIVYNDKEENFELKVLAAQIKNTTNQVENKGYLESSIDETNNSRKKIKPSTTYIKKGLKKVFLF